MKNLIAPLLLVLAAGALADVAAPAPVSVQGAWARPIVKGQDSTGAYMTLTAREPLTLLGAETPAANIVEIHEMRMEGDVMKMRAAETLPLAAGKPFAFKPGGFHFMLMDLNAPFAAGTQVRMTLRFRDAKGKESRLPVVVPVSATAPR